MMYRKGPVVGLLYLSFMLMTNNLCVIHCDVNMYADDTELVYGSESTERINNSGNIDLCNLNTWLKANKMSLSAAK